MKDAFTLELSDSSIKMCDATLSGAMFQIISLGVRESVPQFLSGSEDALVLRQAQIISDLHKRLGIPKKDVRVVIPDSYTYARITQMPRLKERELLAAIKYQADEFIPMPISETSIDLEILSENETENTALLLIIASAKSLATHIEKTVLAAGLNPVSLESELSVAGRLCTDILKPKGKGALIVNFGRGSSSFYAVDGSEFIMRASRTVPIGYSLFQKDISVNMNWDDKKTVDALRSVGLAENASYSLVEVVAPIVEELLKEIRTTIDLMQNTNAMNIDQIYLYNESGNIAYLAPHMQSKLQIPVSELDLNSHIVKNEVSHAFSSGFSSFVSVIAAHIP